MVEHEYMEQEKFRERFSHHLKTLFHVKDTHGIEIISKIHRISRMSEMLGAHTVDEMDLSGPRWRLLLRLMIEEQMGNLDGLTPTDLSRWHRVSKNTISALLRGLEEQGLIERVLDPKDLRVFHIRLTQAGRELVLSTGPRGIERLNELLSGLAPEEVDQLNALLEKLLGSILTQCHYSAQEPKEHNRN